MKTETLLKKLEGIKIPLLILAVGLLILLIPGKTQAESAPTPETELAQLLSDAAGVGEARVLISEHGVLIVCEGADSAAVKLDILRAVGSYTGFGSERITILRLEHEYGRNGK